MAVFGGLTLTNKGRNLEAKVQAGKNLKFKRISIGDGILESENIVEMSELKNEVLSLDIKSIKVLQENIAKITFMLTNQNLTEGFTWRELGVIAEDPDTLEEILYCYGNAGDNGEYISASSGQDIIEKYVSIDLTVSNIENVSAIIDESLVYATQKELEGCVKKLGDTLTGALVFENKDDFSAIRKKRTIDEEDYTVSVGAGDDKSASLELSKDGEILGRLDVKSDGTIKNGKTGKKLLELGDLDINESCDMKKLNSGTTSKTYALIARYYVATDNSDIQDTILLTKSFNGFSSDITPRSGIVSISLRSSYAGGAAPKAKIKWITQKVETLTLYGILTYTDTTATLDIYAYVNDTYSTISGKSLQFAKSNSNSTRAYFTSSENLTALPSTETVITETGLITDSDWEKLNSNYINNDYIKLYNGGARARRVNGYVILELDLSCSKAIGTTVEVLKEINKKYRPSVDIGVALASSTSTLRR